MLFTRCPGCQTTFRITLEALHQAGGQVRCGRCAAVFDAYAELRDETGRAVGPDDAAVAPAAPAVGPEAASSAASAGDSEPRGADAPPAPDAVPDPQPDATQPPAAAAATAAAHSPEDGVGASPPGAAERSPQGGAAADDDALDGLSLQEVMRQIERGSDVDDSNGADDSIDADGDASARDAMTPVQIAAVLEGDHTHTLASPWLPHEPRPSRWWTAGVVVAALALAAQAVHHYRNDLALHELLGAPLRHAYAALGQPLSPRWDLLQYQILDWVATAEPNANGRGSLKITARIHNRGPRAQPYPQIHLQLEDRWDATVGSRVFAPAEYLGRAPEAMMAAGATAQAELEVVDPGPDAYGFELDVCMEMEGALRCRADLPFR
ncbi:MAG TPA: zinc-ribbon and DUF3426 domain-containing protein [Gammaproteobacteria bacterium]